VLAVDGAAPSRDHRLVPREPLQKPQRVLLERDIEEDLDVVQKNHIGCGCAHDFCEEPGQLQGTLALGEVEHAPGKLEVDVDQRSRRALMNILERGRLARTGWGHQHDETVVQLGSLANSLYDSIGEWLRH